MKNNAQAHKGELEIYLIRHGITGWNREKKYIGWTNHPLLESKKHLLDSLKDKLKNIHFDNYYSSDLLRCQQTLTYLYPQHRAILDPRIRELHFGDWEGQTYESLQHQPLYQQWLTDWETVSPPNGETAQAFQSRVQSFLTERIEDYKSSPKKGKMLVVTHGGVIRAIYALMVRELSFWEVSVKHNTGYRLSLNISSSEGQLGHSWTELS